MSEFVSSSESETDSNHIGDIIRVDENTCCATTNLVLGNWSPDYVHGADLMVQACDVVEALLDDGEGVACLENMRFYKLMVNDLVVFASLIPDVPCGYEQQEPSTVASFITTNGRRIYLKCYQTDARVTRRNEADNSFAALSDSFKYVSSTSGEDYDSTDYRFCAPAGRSIDTLGQSVALFLDIGAVAIGRRNDDFFCGGCDAVQLPDFSRFSNGGIIGIAYYPRRARRMPKGFVLRPYEISIFAPGEYRYAGKAGIITAINGSNEIVSPLFKEAGIPIRERRLFV